MATTVMEPERARAARLLLDLLTDARRRGLLPATSSSEAAPETVVVLESDTLESLMRRVRAYAPPVRVAVYHPADDRLGMFLLGRGASRGHDGETLDVSATTSVGMVVDAARQLKIAGTWDEVLTLSRLELSSA